MKNKVVTLDITFKCEGKIYKNVNGALSYSCLTAEIGRFQRKLIKFFEKHGFILFTHKCKNKKTRHLSFRNKNLENNRIRKIKQEMLKEA